MKNDFKQMLHLEPEKGWLNDPNGLCFFKGEYHVYFQYCPDSPEGKSGKCWGHWKSPDMLDWTFTGAVLFPDHPDDRNGVYSGCGFVKGNTLFLFYTGNVKEDGEHDYIKSGRGANVILVTTKNGHDMSKKKTLLKNSDYPEYCSCHVRDPKVFEADGYYYMILGARTLDNEGCVLYYVSDDLENWRYDKTIFAHDGSYMWECPDDFILDGHRFLSVSQQGIPHQKYAYQNVYSAGYFQLDGGVPENYREWDLGFDFYAPQTFLAPDGRRILIAWEGIGDTPYTNPTVALGRQHCLTLPRELIYSKSGVILQRPFKEIENLRKSKTDFYLSYRGELSLPFEILGIAGSDLNFILKDTLALKFFDGEIELAFLSDEAGCGRTKRYAKIGELKNIRIIADRSSIEIYLNDGATVLSSRMYPGETVLNAEINGINGAIYELKGIKNHK